MKEQIKKINSSNIDDSHDDYFVYYNLFRIKIMFQKLYHLILNQN